MEYARIFILCLLCIARASEVPSEEIAEFTGPYVEDLMRIPVQETDELVGQSTENPRDKRALGLLLSGLAQIFGYTVTPIQFASLPNPPNPTNVTRPAAAPPADSSKTVNAKQQAAPSRPANATAPRQQETIRFTGVLNFGNSSDVLGHLQRYEQIFHGRRNDTATMPPANSTNPPTKPPLLAPFFVKIPLPIAPDLLSLMPIEDLGLTPPVSVKSGSNTETPVRKEQEMVYRNNEDTGQYTVEEKDIYDEKDVRKPTGKHNQLYVDEPRWNKQQNDRRNELRRKQEERVKKLQQQEEERNRNKPARYDEEERNEGYKNREKEIAGRNRNQHASKHESEEGQPARDEEQDEGSAERSREYASQENLSDESSKQLSSEKEQSEDYSSYEDDSNKRPEDLNKYVEVGYNQQLPIGDYFHEDNPEVIRDSYGEVLDNKKLKDDRIAGYISMFKQPYVQQDAYDLQRVHPEDTSKEENGKETSEDGYDEHLVRLQKLREEYAPPENKYEEYDLNDESEDDRSDRKSERVQNRTSVGSRRPKPGGRLQDKENDRARRPTGPGHDDVARLENARSQEEVDFSRYMPLVVPVRYIDANDKVQQATMRQLSYKEADKSTDGRFSEDNAGPTRTVFKEDLTPQIGLPERPRHLHEGEHKELQVWPPPFDYAFDQTEPVNTIIPPNPRGYYPRIYAPNYYQHVVKEVAAQDANDKSAEQPSGYLVVVGNQAYPYRYPYNVYYFSNEAVNSRSQAPQLSAEVTRDQAHIAQQDAVAQQFQARPNITGYSLNETRNSPGDYYYQSQEVPASALDRYKYTFGERMPQVKEPFKIEIRSQIPAVRSQIPMENWSNRIYQSPSDAVEQSPRPVFAQSQNIAPSSQNAQSRPAERARYSQLLRRRRRRLEDQRKEGDGKVDEKVDEKANEKAETIPQPIPKNKSFDDPQSAHDFFGFSKDDYNFGSESSGATKVAEENGKTAEESDALVAPEPAAYHHNDESIAIHADEPENNTEKAKVREYRNKVATLREKREAVQRRNDLENRMAEILENLKTRLLVE